jgi:hypothetical protein
MNKAEYVKVAFKLPRGDDGYPPVDWENLWAIPLSDGSYLVDSVPFYVKLISSGDVVAASHVDGQLTFQKFLAAGGHSTVRVIVYEVDRVAELRSKLSGLGCATELSNVPSFFSVDVPPDVNLSAVVNFLERFAGQGVLDYEEASIQHDNGDVLAVDVE